MRCRLQQRRSWNQAQPKPRWQTANDRVLATTAQLLAVQTCYVWMPQAGSLHAPTFDTPMRVSLPALKPGVILAQIMLLAGLFFATRAATTIFTSMAMDRLTVAAFLLLTAQLLFFWTLLHSLVRGEKSSPNPWGAETLEWESPESQLPATSAR